MLNGEVTFSQIKLQLFRLEIVIHHVHASRRASNLLLNSWVLSISWTLHARKEICQKLLKLSLEFSRQQTLISLLVDFSEERILLFSFH